MITNIALGGKPEYGASAGRREGLRESHRHQRSGGDRCEGPASVTRRWSTAPCSPRSPWRSTPRDIIDCSVAAAAAFWRCPIIKLATVVATIPIGTGVDGAGYDAVSSNAFATNADGTLTIVHQDSPDQYHVLQTLETPQGSAQHGSRSHHSSLVRCVGQVRTGACRRPRGGPLRCPIRLR